jgi:Mg-chelatase subunit ChlD
MEMMDAQDKLWEKDINFNTMHVYYHIKENSEGASLIPQKREYQALKRLIDDLDRRKILAASEKSSGFVLTGIALNMLLKYLMDRDLPGKVLQGVIDQGRILTGERKNEVRRYSAGDAFRDISFRQTLKEIVRQKRNLNEVRKSDFRVFMKHARKPKTDIIICIDTSGSMGFHQKLTYARLAAAGIAQAALEEGNRVGLVAFNDYGQASVPLTADDKEGLLNCIASATPRGNTNIGDGIKASVDLLFQSFNSNQKYIMLITDGQPTAISESDFARLKGNQNRDLTEESALLETRRAVARGVMVSVVYISAESEASSEFIKEIARVGKGKIRRISNSDDLKVVMR